MLGRVLLCSLSILNLALAQCEGCSGNETVPSNSWCEGNSTCAINYALGFEYDYAKWVSKDVANDPYWQIPSNASNNATAGDVIKWENISPDNFYTNWTIPGSMSLSRYLYWTEDVNGTLLPASAFMLLPFNLPADGSKLRTIVWAHGTAGYSRQCGPSNNINLYYGWSAPYAYVQQGYAVVAPDYTGLGTDIPQGFMYMAGYSHAADVAFSLIAAKQRAGDVLSDEWVVIGQSEGGMTAWRTNQRLAMNGQEALLKAGSFLGAVAIAPANRPFDIISNWAAQNPPENDPVSAIGVYLLQSLAGLYPDRINLSDYLSDAAYGRLPLSNAACIYGSSYLFWQPGQLTSNWTFKDLSWINGSVADDWLHNYMTNGTEPLAAPMYIIQGTEDEYVPYYQTVQDYQDLCAANPSSSVVLHTYVGLDHDTVTDSGQKEFLPWIASLFDGKSAQEGCSNVTHSPLYPGLFNSIANTYLADDD